MMATLGPESARAALAQLGSPGSAQPHGGGANLPLNRGLERALEEAAASGVLCLSSRKLKEFPRTAAGHDLSDTVEAGRSSGTPGWGVCKQGHFRQSERCLQLHEEGSSVPAGFSSL